MNEPKKFTALSQCFVYPILTAASLPPFSTLSTAL